MIGTGVFTSLGFQLLEIRPAFGCPLTPLVYPALTGGTVTFVLINRFVDALFSYSESRRFYLPVE